ncbi:MAG: hypothetical protein IJX88_05325 [Clostridia bacterium]|nr:hypothetical protein [Clostridia bacterium]
MPRFVSPTARFVAENVFSYTKRKKIQQKDKNTGEVQEQEILQGTRFTYERLREEFGKCRATIASALDELRSAGLIKKADRDLDGTEYVYVGEAVAGKYYLVPLYLFTMEAYDRKKKAYTKLTASEVRVLAYLMSECSIPKNGGDTQKGGGVCCTSYKKLARELGLSQTAIRLAIEALMRMRLVFRPEAHKGVNGKKLSGYEVFAGLYLYKKYIKKAKTAEEAKKARKSYYEDLQAQAKRRAEKYMAIAAKDEAFKKNHVAIRMLVPAMGRAEYEGNVVKVAALKLKEKALKSERQRILSRLGLTLSDITIRCNCDECKDTGQLPGGKECFCYPGGAL